MWRGAVVVIAQICQPRTQPLLVGAHAIQARHACQNSADGSDRNGNSDDDRQRRIELPRKHVYRDDYRVLRGKYHCREE